MSPALTQFLMSFVAILALAGIARWLRLGPRPVLADETAARAAIDAVQPGFRAVALAVDAGGGGLIARDAGGRIVVARPHGSHFAGRLLGPGAWARRDDDALVIDCADRHFGTVRLRVPDPSAWMQAIAGRE